MIIQISNPKAIWEEITKKNKKLWKSKKGLYEIRAPTKLGWQVLQRL